MTVKTIFLRRNSRWDKLSLALFDKLSKYSNAIIQIKLNVLITFGQRRSVLRTHLSFVTAQILPLQTGNSFSSFRSNSNIQS